MTMQSPPSDIGVIKRTAPRRRANRALFRFPRAKQCHGRRADKQHGRNNQR